jgi:hypothetical protein
VLVGDRASITRPEHKVNPAASSKRPRKWEKRKSNLETMGEDHGNCLELGAAVIQSIGIGMV